MHSHIAWVDFSDKEKSKMHDIINSIRKPDTRDELGISLIRDSLSNLMFPGTTTIQTRVKYMLFVPWLYKIIANDSLYGGDASNKIRELEIDLINHLKENTDQTGIIGKTAGRTIQRTAADIYWAGLKTWGILKINASRNDLHHLLELKQENKLEDLLVEKNIDQDDFFVNENQAKIWDPEIPEPPKDFPEEAGLNLTKNQAEYLSDKIRKNCSGTVFSEMLDLPPEEVVFVWEHSELENLDYKYIRQIEHAQKFSEVIHGANLLYNFMLTEKIGENAQSDRRKYEEKIDDWKSLIKKRYEELENWDLNEFWNIVGRTNHNTRSFVADWFEIILDKNNLYSLTSNINAKTLIKKREVYVKGKRSRLENKRYLDMWGGASATSQLDYRWHIAKSFISDIKFALNSGDNID